MIDSAALVQFHFIALRRYFVNTKNGVEKSSSTPFSIDPKNPHRHGTNFNQYSVGRRFHTLYNQVSARIPLSQARTPWTRRARLRSPKACVRAHVRSATHLVLIRFRLTTPLSQAPLLGQDELTRRKRNLDTRGLCVRLHTFTFPQSQTPACLSANLFPSNFDSKAIWHFSAS